MSMLIMMFFVQMGVPYSPPTLEELFRTKDFKIPSGPVSAWLEITPLWRHKRLLEKFVIDCRAEGGDSVLQSQPYRGECLITSDSPIVHLNNIVHIHFPHSRVR
jgi:hypothetical protein